MPCVKPPEAGSQPIAARRADRRAFLSRALAGFWRERGGVAAIEFALISPLLLCMSFLSMEVGQGLETNRKLVRSSASIALVATQQSGSVSKSELDAMMSIGSAALQPYNRSNGTFIVTGVKMSTDSPPKAKVVWSRSLVDGVGTTGYAKDSETYVPDALRTAGTFLVKVEAKLDYKPMIAWTDGSRKTLGGAGILWPIKMNEKSYQVTRDLNQDIACPDC